ncbi:HEAT repeat-containing protein [Rhynchospora pubera]|uniref:HEAT repeat-containing protein n=1 Tax=Rhynchospora pubera TaxID=906938 RepID=A0AAV8EQW4_9POAL|nr:HEAT repeat-containing protein [Rhynchospora pubera]
MAKRGGDAALATEGMALSRFGVLVSSATELESIAASAPYQPPDPLLCFDLLSQLVSSIEEEPKESIQLWQRKCEDALFSLLTFGARRPVRRLASVAMGRVIEKGDGISIYSRASTLQGFLVDGKKIEPTSCAGAAQCLGELYRLFGRRITAGLVETTNIVSKLMKYSEDYVRQDALLLLENALEGSGGGGAPASYMEAYRIIMRLGLVDKSLIVRLAAARCLKTFGSIGGIGLGMPELESSLGYCVKGLEDQVPSVRDAFADALGALLALSMNPDAQVKMKKGKNQTPVTKKSEDSLQKYLIAPFVKASGVNAKKLRIGLALSCVFFFQVIHLKYHYPHSELQNLALKAMEMLQGSGSIDPHSLACVLYILRVGVADQLTEPAQRDFLVLLGRKLESSDCSPSVRVATLRILSYLLKSLGEVPAEFKDVLDNTVVAALSHFSVHVRIEAALTLRALAEVDPTCVGGLISLGITTLNAVREIVSFDKGNNLSGELATLHGQAAVLAALVAISPKLLLGYPARLPKSVFEVSKEMLNTASRNLVAATAVREAGWLLLSSLVSSMPKEELEDQAFDILLLWAGSFAGNPEQHLRGVQDWTSELRVLSVSMEALTVFIKSFISPKATSTYGGILLQPVLAYLSGALSLISLLSSKRPPNAKSALDLLTTRVLMAYQSISDPLAYKSEHTQIMRVCSGPISEPSGWAESSLLRILLDKRDACLGPWIPGRDSFEDELRAFEGGSDGLLPCVWDDDVGNFPQPESVSKILVNQMLLCFGNIFACQDNHEKIALLKRIDQSLRTGKKQSWYLSFVTNACVGLLSGLKSILSFRTQELSAEILSFIQSILQAILRETVISPAQKRAACEGLGLLGRVANDVFTARMTRSLLGELALAVDSNHSGSIALSLGCIHRSAGGIALSILVPSTVSSISALCKSTDSTLQLWSLHALLLSIEAAGLSYVSQVQATLLLVMEILLLDENGYLDLRQEIGRLINAIVAVLGPELSPGSTFFSRCKSVIEEVSSSKETATLLESVRFTQQLVLFAPQAATVHSHVQNLIPTLSSRQPSLRYLAVSTLHHLIERDPAAMINENIEENLFSMLDEETDSEIANLVRSTINRLLYSSCPQCPSRWLAILRNMVLATSSARNDSLASSGTDNINGVSDTDAYYGDEDDMISGSKQGPTSISSNFLKRNKHLRYRTRIFAAECLSCVPTAVGTEPAHFDLSLARNQTGKGHNTSADWLVLKLQELISLSYQISTGQFEGMQPTGVRLLSVIMDQFGNAPDPDFPGHILLEQYQAQLVSAVRSAISTASAPLLLDAGLELATKILTSSIIGGDRVALNRLYLLISRPLSEIQDLCYPSFADWVACKIKVQLLTAHASVKCYVYQLFRRKMDITNEYLQLVPLLSNNSALLQKYWIGMLNDYIYICFGLQLKANYKPFLDGIQSPLVLSKVEKYLKDTWPLILESTVLDAAPSGIESDKDMDLNDDASFISGRSMAKLEKTEFRFIWGFSKLLLFHSKGKNSELMVRVDDQKLIGVVLTVFLCLTKEVFFKQEFVSLEMCHELLQALLLVDSNDLVASLLCQIVKKCPDTFFEADSFVFGVMPLCSRCLLTNFQNKGSTSLLSELTTTSETILLRMSNKHQEKFATSLMSLSYQSYVQVSTNSCLSKVILFLQGIIPIMKRTFSGDSGLHEDTTHSKALITTWACTLAYLSKECTKKLNVLDYKSTESSKSYAKILVFCFQEIVSLAGLVYDMNNQSEKQTTDTRLVIVSLNHCSECIRDSLHDTNIQVNMLGLHVLKTLAHRELAEGNHRKSSTFVLLLGELLGDIFNLLRKTLKRCKSKDEVTVINEGLKLFFLFHTLVQLKSCETDATKLLLEAFLMVFTLSVDGHSQELDEANATTRRLISHFVQIPSAATQIKDVMLSVSNEKRQQFQDMIRVSLGQGQMAMPVSSSKPDTVAISDKIQETNSDASHSVPHEVTGKEVDTNETYDNNNNYKQDNINDYDNDDDDDDDWDSFQSLPATNNAISSEESEKNTETEATGGMVQEAKSTNLEKQDDDMESKNEVLENQDLNVNERGVELFTEGEIGESKDVSSSMLEDDEKKNINVDEQGAELCTENEVGACRDVSSSMLEGGENQDANLDEHRIELCTEDEVGLSKDASSSMLDEQSVELCTEDKVGVSEDVNSSMLESNENQDPKVDKQGVELCSEDEVGASKDVSRSMLGGSNKDLIESKEVHDSTKE